MEPLYLVYITKHPIALEHLNSLPQTPALTAYLAESRSLASKLTHAWDLPSLLIKPVQRLLKYPLLLGAIYDETPDGHPDKECLRRAREMMEQAARGVNEGRRRREVIKEVLSSSSNGTPSKRHSDPKPKPKKKGLNISVSASVSLGRMKSFSMKSGKAKEGAEANEEAAQVVQLAERVKECEVFARAFAKEAVEWCKSMEGLMEQLSRWSTSFGEAIGVTGLEESEAFAAFIQVATEDLPALCVEFTEEVVQAKLLPHLTKLVDSTLAPLRLVEAMRTLEPLHLALLNLNLSKTRPPPQMLEASQSYLALRAQLAAEMPTYLALLTKGLTDCTNQFNVWQAQFYRRIKERWLSLWDSLKVEGEMNAGAAETVRVWWSRWADVEAQVMGLNIVHPSEKRLHPPEMTRQKSRLRMRLFDDDSSETSSTVVISSSILTLDPALACESLSSPSTLSLQTPVSAKARSVRSFDASRRLERRSSSESLRSKKSGKSAKSAKSMGHQGSHSIATIDSDAFGYGYGDTANMLGTTPRKLRTKEKRVPAPLPLKKSSSHGRLLDDAAEIRRRSPRRSNTADRATPSPRRDQFVEELDRGRPSRKPSFKRRLTETFLPNSSSPRHHRSPSAPGHPSPSISQSVTPSLSTPSSSRHQSRRPSSGGARVPWIPSLYPCRVVHPCEPPAGVSYRDLPFFTLRVGDTYDVLQEAGHPALHDNLPLYVDDGEDCLLLVRNRSEDVGWALASFMLPAD